MDGRAGRVRDGSHRAMNPYLILGVAGAFVVVSAIAGVQSYRLQGAHGEIKLFQAADKERVRAAAVKAGHDLKNKERTDAQYALDVRAARAAGVRAATPTGGFLKPAAAGSPDPEIVCFGAGELDRELGEWAARVAGRLSGVAQQAEEVAAAYRACKAWGLSLE